MKNPYTREIHEIINELGTSEASGLTDEEAKSRLVQYGYNQLETNHIKSFLSMFLAQFKSFMIIILIFAAAISGFVGIMEGEGLLDTFVIIGILILNAFVGALQERKAESSLEALRNLSAAESVVLRNGAIKEIPTKDIVPGDIVIIETGVIIPADLRVTEAVNLQVQESALTGESLPVTKQTGSIGDGAVALGDRTNMGYSGSIVTYGRGRGVVISTGMRTEVGKIAEMLQQTPDTETPMSKRLELLGKTLGIASLIICGLIFLVGVLYGNSALGMFMTAVSLAVAAIPEGLPAVSTIVLAIGVQRMVKRNAIIRNLPSVETLGSATVICSDKTGTLTQNKMTVTEAYVNHKRDAINRAAPATALDEEETRLLTIAVLCNDARINTNENNEPEFAGDPTETALLEFGNLYGMHKDQLDKKFPRIAEIPFDSERKRMTTVNRLSEESSRINVKGGLEEVLQVCDKIILHGEVRPISSQDREQIRKANENMADSALRVLAMAYRDIREVAKKSNNEDLENNLIFIGLLGMIDPARPEVVQAVRKCNAAGIRPVMITGDHKGTAVAIAGEIGIYKEGDTVITGSELENLNEDDFLKNVSRYSVYARVAPEHKVRIVKAWQYHGEVVAMTGDGVNDAPALKQADIGAAMGIAGTDVAKGAADMVLTDDNFATIVSAIEEGRRIYDNILKVIQFLLSTNIGEIFLLLVTAVFNMGVALLPIHILWVNLVTDSLPALALSVDPAEEGIMERKPRKTKGGFFTRGMIWRIMYQGIMLGAIPLAAYIIGRRDGGEPLGQTMAFTTLIFVQLVHVRNLHSNTRSSLTISPFENKPLIAAIFASAGLALLVLLIPPVRETFGLVFLDGGHWIIIVAMSLTPIIVVDIFKLFRINGTDD
jgi:Ca2+-transporting ATPase